MFKYDSGIYLSDSEIGFENYEWTISTYFFKLIYVRFTSRLYVPLSASQTGYSNFLLKWLVMYPFDF